MAYTLKRTERVLSSTINISIVAFMAEEWGPYGTHQAHVKYTMTVDCHHYHEFITIQLIIVGLKFEKLIFNCRDCLYFSRTLIAVYKLKFTS